MGKKVCINFACMDLGCDFCTRAEADTKDEAVTAAFKEHDADRKKDGREICPGHHYDVTMGGETIHY